MLKLLFEAFIYVMALYGMLNIIGNALDSFARKKNLEKTTYKLILSVKNQQEVIEGIIRSIFSDELFSGMIPDAKVVVIDKGSTDETLRILRKLQDDYENLEVIEEE